MLSKYLIIIACAVGIAIGSGGTLFISKAVKPVVKLSCPECPEQKPCNGIDFDKIKSRALTIQNHQHLTVSGDSLMVEKLIGEFRKELQALRLARCK
jgi:hypothetical protein